MKKENKVGKEKNQRDESVGYAFLATFLSIIGFFLVVLLKRDDKYAMHYAKQSAVVFLFCLIISFLSEILSHISILGKIIGFASMLVIAFFWIVSWIYSLSGNMKDVPLIGKYGRRFNF